MACLFFVAKAALERQIYPFLKYNPITINAKAKNRLIRTPGGERFRTDDSQSVYFIYDTASFNVPD